MECSRCHQRGDGLTQAFLECAVCKAVLYCSVQCQQDDWDESNTQYSHKNWCQKFLDYMKNEAKLCEFPFTFAKETTSHHFNQRKLKTLLQKYGVYNEGLWKRVCEEKTSKPFIQYGDLTDDGLGYVLEKAGSLLSCPASTPVPLCPPVGDWDGYYRWRGLGLESPVAHLLSNPLTVYYIITTCLREDDPNCFHALMKEENLHIMLLGVEKEVEMLSVFQELLNLLPQTSIHIDMVGKGISKKCPGKRSLDERLNITVHRSYYHEWDGETPHIIIGLNAGIAAYRSWQPTIEKIQHDHIPAYFTDYCEYFMDITDRTLRDSNSGELTERRINPFRSPFRITSEDNYLPWFSNCMICAVTPKR